MELDADRLDECPLGLLHREASYVFDAIAACASIAEGAVGWASQPRWLQAAYAIWSAERARHEEARYQRQRAERDSDYGLRVRRGAR